MRLSNILFAYSEQKQQKIIVLKGKKKLKYYILRLKKAEKLYSDYKHFSIGYV